MTYVDHKISGSIIHGAVADHGVEGALVNDHVEATADV